MQAIFRVLTFLEKEIGSSDDVSQSMPSTGNGYHVVFFSKEQVSILTVGFVMFDMLNTM